MRVPFLLHALRAFLSVRQYHARIATSWLHGRGRPLGPRAASLRWTLAASITMRPSCGSLELHHPVTRQSRMSAAACRSVPRRSCSDRLSYSELWQPAMRHRSKVGGQGRQQPPTAAHAGPMLRHLSCSFSVSVSRPLRVQRFSPPHESLQSSGALAGSRAFKRLACPSLPPGSPVPVAWW